MSEKKVDALANLFHEKAVFVHMGGTMTREHELNVIKTGEIHYKKADIHDVGEKPSALRSPEVAFEARGGRCPIS